MLGSLAKVVGLSVASLGSFNMPTKQAENNIQTTTHFAEIYLEDYEDSQRYLNDYTSTQIAFEYTEYIAEGLRITNNITYTWYYQRSHAGMLDGSNDDFIYYDQNNNLYSDCSYLLIKIDIESQQYIQLLMADIVYNIQSINLTGSEQVNSTTKMFVSNEAPLWNNKLALGTQEHDFDIFYTTSEEIKYMTKGEGKPWDLTEINLGTYIADYRDTAETHTVYLENQTLNYTKNQNKPYWILITNENKSYTTDVLKDYEIQFYRLEQLNFVVSENTIVEIDVVDIPGLCFDILTMPFSFISQAFNLTLFAGTQYQINISNLFLSLIGILVFIFIVKKLIARG